MSNRRPEPRAFHAAVVALRRRGFRVLRAGRWLCEVNGVVKTAAEIMRLYRTTGAETL